jgi:hypothetical protein
LKQFLFILLTVLALTACNSPAISPKTLPGSHQGIIIQNSMVNDTTVPVELTINFPADSIKMQHNPGLYLRLFLPPDTMTMAKEPEYNYGAKGLLPFLDTGLNKPTVVQVTLNPKEEHLFYVGALIYPDGRARSGLLINGQNLVYAINISPALDSVFIPCGQIIYKK